MTHENHRRARHRTLILMYITYLTLSLAPAMVAPPERSFDRGQPELQQSMDNMVVRETVIQKRASNSPKDKDQNIAKKQLNNIPKDEDVNGMKSLQEANSKTSNLLAEAETVLKTLPDSKERQWVESFVERMREIEKMIKTTTQHKNLEKDIDPRKGSPVSDGLPKRRAQPATTAVPKSIPYQKPKSMMAKIQMTSPEIKRVLSEDEQLGHQAVTKPLALSRKAEETESDELVRELQSLHEENSHQSVSANSKANNEAGTTTTPSTPLVSEDNETSSVHEESEKARLEEAKLVHELEDFHRRGGTLPKAIIDVLNADNHKTTGSAENRKINIDEEMKFTEAGMKDRRGTMRLKDLSNEEKEIAMANMRNMPPYATHQYLYLSVNHTFPNKHPNMVHEFPRQIGPHYQSMPPMYKAQPYQYYPQNMNQYLQKKNPYIQGKYPNLGMPHQPVYNPAVLNQRVPRPQFYYNGRLPPYNYPNYSMRPAYAPYPYAHNWNPQNSSNHLPQMMPPYVNSQPKMDTQLSDEMKRQLRDGKIIVLSDSVVRSNFQPDKNEKSPESATEKPELKQVDVKNETITKN